MQLLHYQMAITRFCAILEILLKICLGRGTIQMVRVGHVSCITTVFQLLSKLRKSEIYHKTVKMHNLTTRITRYVRGPLTISYCNTQLYSLKIFAY